MEKTKRFNFLSFQAGTLVGVIIAFTLAAFAVKHSELLSQKPLESDIMFTEGYNFHKIHNSNYSWRGPNLGEKINLSRLNSSDGKSLSELTKTRCIMLITLDPECQMCNVSGDLINSVREGLKSIEIEYYPISFTQFEGLTDINQYSSSLGFQSKFFTWAKEGELPQESLQNMVTPAHLLLDNTGKVLQVWAGSSREKTVRDKMSQQIISDTIIINDTLTALKYK